MGSEERDCFLEFCCPTASYFGEERWRHRGRKVLKDFLEHRRFVHGTDDLDAVFECVACQMLKTQLARAERLEGGAAEPTVQ